MKKIFFYIIFTIVANAGYSQSSMQYFISLNGNLYLPINSDKQSYPILAYDKDADPKVLLGGFGIGFTTVKEWKEKFLLKGQLNFSRHAYWDDPILLTDVTNNPLGFYTGKSVDYVLGMTATVQYRLGKKIALGTGLGADILLHSVYNISEPFFEGMKIENEYYKTIAPVLPLELSFYLNKVLLNIRYEQGLINRYREAYAAYEKELNGILVFEFGYRLN